RTMPGSSSSSDRGIAVPSGVTHSRMKAKFSFKQKQYFPDSSGPGLTSRHEERAGGFRGTVAGGVTAPGRGRERFGTGRAADPTRRDAGRAAGHIRLA